MSPKAELKEQVSGVSVWYERPRRARTPVSRDQFLDDDMFINVFKVKHIVFSLSMIYAASPTLFKPHIYYYCYINTVYKNLHFLHTNTHMYRLSIQYPTCRYSEEVL